MNLLLVLVLSAAGVAARSPPIPNFPIPQPRPPEPQQAPASPGTFIKDDLEKIRDFVKANPIVAKSVLLQIAPFLISALDVNKDGALTQKDLREIHASLTNYWRGAIQDPAGLVEVWQFIQKLDPNRDNTIDLNEILSLVVGEPDAKEWDALASGIILLGIDTNRNAFISDEELNKMDPQLAQLIAPALMLQTVEGPVAPQANPVPPSPPKRPANPPSRPSKLINLGRFITPAEPAPPLPSIRGGYGHRHQGQGPQRQSTPTQTVPVVEELKRLREIVKADRGGSEQAVRSVGTELLNMLDVDGDGEPTSKDLHAIYGELADYWRTAITPRSGLRLVSKLEFLRIDFTNNGEIVLPELLAVIIDNPDSPTWNALVSAFYLAFDQDRDGNMTPQEFASIPEDLKPLLAN